MVRVLRPHGAPAEWRRSGCGWRVEAIHELDEHLLDASICLDRAAGPSPVECGISVSVMVHQDTSFCGENTFRLLGGSYPIF